MASGASTYKRLPSEKITLAECQALIESKVAERMTGPLVTIRYAFGLAVIALAVSLIALTVAVVR